MCFACLLWPILLFFVIVQGRVCSNASNAPIAQPNNASQRSGLDRRGVNAMKASLQDRQPTWRTGRPENKRRNISRRKIGTTMARPSKTHNSIYHYGPARRHTHYPRRHHAVDSLLLRIVRTRSNQAGMCWMCSAFANLDSKSQLAAY